MQNIKENEMRLSVSEASKLFGISTKSVRLAIKAHELQYTIINKRYKINFGSLIRWSTKTKRRANKLARQGMGQYVEKWRSEYT